MPRIQRVQGGSLRMELVRKAGHALIGILLVLGLASQVIDGWILAFLTLILAGVILYNAFFERELLTRVLAINRADATVPGLDLLAYFVGCLLAVALFPTEIALAAILILAIGDPLAHLFGTSFGGRLAAVTPTSYRLGFLAGTTGGALAAWIFVPFLPAFLAALAAMFVEAGELRIANHHVDDNLTIPLVAGLILWVLWSIAIDFGATWLWLA